MAEMLAAFALGAEGVQIGTRFVCSTECIVHENYKKAVVEAKDRDAVATGRKTGHPVRCLKNKLTREFEKLENSNADKEELEKLGAGALRKAAVLGDIEYGSVMAGQISGLISDIKPCRRIIDDLIKEYNENLKKLKEWCI